MLFFVGDIHGEYNQLHNNVANMIVKLERVPTAIIQVGDFGFYTPDVNAWENHLGIPVYYIDGNHENFDDIKNNPNRNGLTYIPRGTVMEIDGKVIAFCGGACSVDKYMRRSGEWWIEEIVTDDDVQRTIDALNGVKPDYLITHTPPVSVIRTHFGPITQGFRDYFNLPLSWVDKSSQQIEKLWNHLDRPQIISGHMHDSVVGPNYRILNIGEVYVIE